MAAAGLDLHAEAEVRVRVFLHDFLEALYGRCVSKGMEVAITRAPVVQREREGKPMEKEMEIEGEELEETIRMRRR